MSRAGGYNVTKFFCCAAGPRKSQQATRPIAAGVLACLGWYDRRFVHVNGMRFVLRDVCAWESTLQQLSVWFGGG